MSGNGVVPVSGMTDFEIRRMANGWLVFPARYHMDGHVMPQDKSFVFSSAEQLADWLRVECKKVESQ